MKARPREPVDRLHFVYNVDATPRALHADFVHRLLDPATYPCRLCDLTYGRLVKKRSWQAFLRTLPVRSRFYTRDRFARQYPQLRHEFPVVLAESAAGAFRVFLSSRDLARLDTLDALQSAVLAHLASARAPA